MAAFQFPNPAEQTTVTNPITGSTYQWKEPPGKWVVTVKMRDVGDIIWEGDNPPSPVGDYKLWYSTDTLELYFHYCDINDVCAWIPTSAPITLLEDLDTDLSGVKQEIQLIETAVNENEARIAGLIDFGTDEPHIWPDEKYPQFDADGDPVLDENGEQVILYEQSSFNHKFWLNTTTNKLYVLRIDESADSGYSYQLIDTNDNATLQDVLTNGNVADKGFVLTNLADDAILVSPEQARIMVGGVGANVVPKIELRHETGILDTSLVGLELDEDGKRFDIECDERVDNIHFRFEEDVKLELNKTGDAIFSGKVQAEAATNDKELVNLGQFNEDQLRQDKALILLEGEIEQLAPSFARGTWNWDDGDGYVDAGEYVMRGTQTQESRDAMLLPLQEELSECLSNSSTPQEQSVCTRAYDEASSKIPEVGESITTYDWELTNEIEFSNYDSQGNVQTFEDVKVGQILDMVCPDGSFMVAEITKVTAGQWYENPHLEYKPITTKGDANGLTKLKIFSIDDGIDPGELTDFVRKSGDTMDGHLKVTNPSKTDGTYLFSVEAQGLPYQNKKVAFRVTADGKVKAGHDTSNAFIASSNNDVVTKKFTDDKLVKKSGDEMTGKLTITKPSGDNPTNSFIINQFVTNPDGTIEQKVLLKDYKPQKTAEYKSSIFYYGLCDNDASIVNRGYANDHFFQIDQKNQTTEPIWIRPQDANGNVTGNAGQGNMLVVNQESGNKGSIIRIQQNGTDCFKIEVDQTVNLFDNRIKGLADPVSGDNGATDAINRQYLENYVEANVRRLWKWTGDQSSNPGPGKFSIAQSGAGYCYFDHRPYIGSDLLCVGNKYFARGGDSLSPGKELGYAIATFWEWTGKEWIPIASGSLGSTGVRTGKNNEPWRLSFDKNTVDKLADFTTDGLYAICVAGTVLT